MIEFLLYTSRYKKNSFFQKLRDGRRKKQKKNKATEKVVSLLVFVKSIEFKRNRTLKSPEYSEFNEANPSYLHFSLNK